MKYIYPISLILLSSYQLCFSNTISVGNATYTIPEDWTTDYAYTFRAGVSDSSNSRYFEIGTGYAFRADYLPDEEYNYVQDTSGFENGSIQSSESVFAIINKLDTDIYRAMHLNNEWRRAHDPIYLTTSLTPVSFVLLAEGAYERVYSYTLITDSGMSSFDRRTTETGTIGIIIDADSISYYKEVENNPDYNSLTLEETSTLYNISDSYTTSNPLTIIDKPTDSDVDGIPDVIETYLGNDPNDNSDAQASLDGIQSKYSLDEIVDLRAGSTMISVENETATLSMEIEKSSDLSNWTFDRTTTVDIPIEDGVETQFFRFKMADPATTITVTVGVDTIAGQNTGVFYFNGAEKAVLEFEKGTKYTFIQNDSSNATYGSANHPLMFSTGAGGDLFGNGHYTAGVVYKLDGVTVNMAGYVSGFVAASDRRIEWTVSSDAPSTLYYWCHIHTGQGAAMTVID